MKIPFNCKLQISSVLPFYKPDVTNILQIVDVLDPLMFECLPSFLKICLYMKDIRHDFMMFRHFVVQNFLSYVNVFQYFEDAVWM